MCINSRTYHVFQVMGVEVAEVAVDVVMDAVVVVVADLVENKDKSNPTVPNLLIWIDWIFQEDVKLKR